MRAKLKLYRSWKLTKKTENVKEFTYLCSIITDDYIDAKEVRRLGIARNVMVPLASIWKDVTVSIPTRKRMPPFLIFF